MAASPKRDFPGTWVRQSSGVLTVALVLRKCACWRSSVHMGDAMNHQKRSSIETAFLNVENTAAYLGISMNTLYIWRHRRQGPPSFRMGPGGRVMYRRDLLEAWLAQQQMAD
jgi:predicted DNA-binding transcriptional regulator AlpA